jgi:opacity protein-like surface antigen
MLFVGSSKLAKGQSMAEKNKFSTIELGWSNAYFMGSDAAFKTNRDFSPGMTVSVMTKQGGRISNGFCFTMNFPTTRNVGRKDESSDYTFVFYGARVHRYDFFIKTDLVQHRSRLQKRPDFTPYLYTGMGWMKFKQFIRYGDGKREAVSSLTGDRYDNRSLALPIGLGLRYKLAAFWDLSLEVLYAPVFSSQLDLDYLNGFTNSSTRDHLLTVNLKLGYL